MSQTINSLADLHARPVGVEKKFIEALKSDIYIRHFTGEERSDLLKKMIINGKNAVEEMTNRDEPEQNDSEDNEDDADAAALKNLDVIVVSSALCDKDGNLLCQSDEDRIGLMKIDNVALWDMSVTILGVNNIGNHEEAISNAKKG